jgi:large subunit ribosomal protein L21
MKIAVIATGGKQYKVKEGQSLRIEKLDAELGSTVTLDTLLVAESDGSSVTLGQPSLGDKVSAEIIEHAQADKVHVVKFKNKTHYKRNVGHRQLYTKILVKAIA